MAAGNPQRDAAFRFAHKIKDAAFRQLLTEIGCSDTQDIVVALDSTPVTEVMERVFRDTKPPALVTFEVGGEPGQFALIMVRPTTSVADAGADQVIVHPEASIGMLLTAAATGRRQTFVLGDHFGYDLRAVPESLATS